MRFTRAYGGLGEPATRATWTPEGWRCHCGAVIAATRGSVGGSSVQCPRCRRWWRGRGANNGYDRMIPVDDDAMGTS